MSQRVSGIPDFRPDGYLPAGLFLATEAECTFRFGTQNRRRRRLVLRVRHWTKLAREVKALRLLIDGSFVTAKEEPDDVDAVVWLPESFETQVKQGIDAAVELEEMLSLRLPEEIFAAFRQADWDNWVSFFSRTREADRRKKGLVEIVL
jgi:hypothetical protein